MVTLTSSSTCSLTVLVQLNWNTMCPSSTCRTHTTLYSVSSSVSCRVWVGGLPLAQCSLGRLVAEQACGMWGGERREAGRGPT